MRMGLPTAMTWHCMLDRFATVVSALGVVRRWAARGMAMSAVSDVAAHPLRRVVGADAPVTVLPNGIDVSAWRPRTPRPEDGVVRFVTAMRLAARKRPLPLMRVMRRVRDLVPSDVPIHLEVLGEGPDRTRIERFLSEQGMASWVSLPGRVSRASVRERYACADVYVSPARLESFGIAALEARTAGLPVVARHGSGVGEFVADGINGFLPADDDGMAAALARLASDTALRTSMRDHNLVHPPEQDWASVADLAEAEYLRAMRAAVRA
jgi:glycosyltransferase involved in cell wall biosynthesis